MGFDTVELNVRSLDIPEEALLRFVRSSKSSGLKVRPVFAIKFNKSDIPDSSSRAYGAYILPKSRSSGKQLSLPAAFLCMLKAEFSTIRAINVYYNVDFVEDVNLLIRRAERCLEAGADMIMIDAEDVCQRADSVRADVIAKVIGCLGVEKTLFEASNGKTSEWFIKQYGPNVNIFGSSLASLFLFKFLRVFMCTDIGTLR